MYISPFSHRLTKSYVQLQLLKTKSKLQFTYTLASRQLTYDLIAWCLCLAPVCHIIIVIFSRAIVHAHVFLFFFFFKLSKMS